MASSELSLTDEQRALRAGVLEICKRYPGEYWRDLDARREYPEKFVTELTEAGYLAALSPPEYGGAGLGIREGGLILETINYSGGNAGACHAQMYIMGTVLRHGSEAQKREYLPKIATGALRLQAFGVTEPNSGSDTTKLQTTAIRKGDRYIVNGQRILVASDSLGDARWFIEKAVAYSNQRVIFGRPIGANQCVQFAISRSHISTDAAQLMRDKAAALFDAGQPCGGEANMAKFLGAEAAWEAGNACIDCHGGYGYAEEYDVERKFRVCRLYKTAPINNNLILAYLGVHLLGMAGI